MASSRFTHTLNVFVAPFRKGATL
ncbi:unnamed protein product [Cuscuta epithymum]|uniref:Uncharacterized protein n=1 Tax=Cuscuta epithymum TaxID=186058 RepID=A0AAV0FNF7_9ASTE|nr:unnamed protein product [Cuscuta epithymum]